MSEPFIGQITIFAGNFAPNGWALCDGQLLRIDQFSALFSLIGTTYGGDGQTTFALPDLRGRAPIHQGQGAGLNLRRMGERGGEESVTLSVPQLPPHNHSFSQPASSSEGTTQSPALAYPAIAKTGECIYASSTDTTLGAGTSTDAGGGQSHNNMQPYLTVNYIIALQGIYPPRS